MPRYLVETLLVAALTACGGPQQPSPQTLHGAATPSGQDAAAQREREGDRDREGNHCVLPWGTDWNEALDLDQAIVIYSCPKIPARTPWVPLQIAFFNGGTDPLNPLLYPAGYTPQRRLPIDDYFSKLGRVRYLVTNTDSGKVQQQTFEARRVVERATIATLWTGTAFFPPEWMGFGVLAFKPALPGLAAGHYEATIDTELSAPNCDGFTDSVPDSCYPAGFSSYGPYLFEVVPR